MSAAPAAVAQTADEVNVRPSTEDWADLLRVTPYFVGGEQAGYRIYPGADARTFRLLGLRPGDLLVEIDGRWLNDPQSWQVVLTRLEEQGGARVTVERGQEGAVLELNLDGAVVLKSPYFQRRWLEQDREQASRR